MAGNLLNQLFRGGSEAFGKPVHTNTYKLSLIDSVHTDEVAEDTEFRNVCWPSSKKVDSNFRIEDVGSKHEEAFVLVDMAESFVNTWLTSILLGLMP